MGKFNIDGIWYDAATYKEAKAKADAAHLATAQQKPVAQPITPPVVFTVTVTPEDNFAGRNPTKFGIGEKLNLGFTTQPARTAASFGGLKWRVKSGPGVLTTPVPTDGTAELTMGEIDGSVILELCTVTQPVTVKATKTLWVIGPSSAVMVQKTGTNIYHIIHTASAGFKGEIQLRPKDVSFYRCELREGSAVIKATGSLNIKIDTQAPDSDSSGQSKAVKMELDNLKGARHPVMGQWAGFNRGNLITGSVMNGDDTVKSLTINPPFAAGTFDWEIPWYIRVIGSMAEKHFFTATHSEVITSTGQMTISKGGFSVTRQAIDLTSNF